MGKCFVCHEIKHEEAAINKLSNDIKFRLGKSFSESQEAHILMDQKREKHDFYCLNFKTFFMAKKRQTALKHTITTEKECFYISF